MTIYIVKDDYTPDYPTIWGVFATRELAKEHIKHLKDPNNEFGYNQNVDDTIEIDSHNIIGIK